MRVLDLGYIARNRFDVRYARQLFCRFG